MDSLAVGMYVYSSCGVLLINDQVTTFFGSSQLPPATLAQIWELSDQNKDGKFDIKV